MPDPMYKQIAEDLREKIESGRLGHGAQLPTELELRDQYDASRNTVRDAVKSLITRGLVETRPGQGTFVVEKIDPFVTAVTPKYGFGGSGAYILGNMRDRKLTASDPRVEIQRAGDISALKDVFDEDAMVVSRFQQRSIDGTPWSLQTTFYPMRYVEQGATRLLQATDIAEGAVRYLEAEIGLEEAGTSDVITVRPPDANETVIFGLPGDGRVNVFETRRTGYVEDGEAIRVTVTTSPADRNQFVLNVGRIPDGIVASEDNRSTEWKLPGDGGSG
jgi:GntR family transcriptional regulator